MNVSQTTSAALRALLALLVFVSAVLGSPAYAQDDEHVDGHDLFLAPDDGHPLDLVTIWRPEQYTPMKGGAQVMAEFAKSPVVLYRREYNAREADAYPLLDNLFGLNLGAFYAANPKFAFSATMPVFFTSSGVDPISKESSTSGPALGDLRLAAPITVRAPEPGVDGFGFSVVPLLDLPTGNQARWLGSEGVNAGVLIASGYTDTRFHITGNLGFEYRPRIEFRNLVGGPRLLMGVGGALMLNDEYSARAEVNLRPNLLHAQEVNGIDNWVRAAEMPGELILSMRGAYAGGLFWTAGGSLPYTRGTGAASFRLFAGVGYNFGPPVEPDTDLDGLVDSLDLCPERAEDFNGYVDDDGCPDLLAALTIRVQDTEGNTVTNATVDIDGQGYLVDGAGTLRLEELIPGTSPYITVGAPYMFEETVADLTLAEGENERLVVLEWMPGRVKIVTRSNKGAIVDAKVRLDGPQSLPPTSLGDDGEEIFELPPGQWRAMVSAEAFGTERRDFRINPGETSLIVIEVILQPTLVQVTEKEIVILEKVFFDFDKATIKEESFPVLDQVANTMLDHPHILMVEVQGHTDSKGSDEYNKELSQRRVESVVTYLTDKGVDASRLKPVGYGEEVPIATNKTSAGRAKNRRVQFIILETEASRAAKEAEEAAGGAEGAEEGAEGAEDATEPAEGSAP
ncbi:MAG: OmpA family protein [Alphaproteobacteria bacterium]|nr:OmpA family protein [Alphaproteobacteria bacterium]